MHIPYRIDVAEFHMGLNASLITVAWELSRPHNTSKHVGPQCWRSPTETTVITYLTTATAVPEPPLPLWRPRCVEGAYQDGEGKMCFLSAFCLDSKADNLLLTCKIPSSFLLSVRGTVVFSSAMPTALGCVLVSTDHRFLI